MVEQVGFPEFRAVLWSKIKQYAVIQAAMTALDDGATWPELIDAAREFAESPAGNAGKYTPNPDTWLRDGRHLDDQEAWWTYKLEGEKKAEASRKYQRRREINERIGKLTDDEWRALVERIHNYWNPTGFVWRPNTPYCVELGLDRNDFRSRQEAWYFYRETRDKQAEKPA